MSKPNSTNYPNAFMNILFYLYASLNMFLNYLMPLGGYGGEETPDPIPNSEVKLTCADGTACLWESRSLPILKNLHKKL